MFAFERLERREVITTTAVWRKGEPETLATRNTITDRYAVSGIPAMPCPPSCGSRSGRLYRPVSVKVERTDNLPASVTVSGALERKDGQLGGGALHVIHGLGGRDRPVWLAAIVRDAEAAK